MMAPANGTRVSSTMIKLFRCTHERNNRNPGIAGGEGVHDCIDGFPNRLLGLLARWWRRWQTHQLSLRRVVILIDVTQAESVGLLLAGRRLILRVIFRIAVEAILNQKTNREKQDRCR